MDLTNSQLEDLIRSYSGIIRAICRKYYLVGGGQDDLFQEGMIGLFEAYQKYEGEGDYTSAQFRNFANLCIKRQIYDAIKHANKKNNSPLNSYMPISKTSGGASEYTPNYIYALDAVSPEDIVIDQEEIEEKFDICRKNLSNYEISVLDLYLQGEKQSQIAAKLDKSVKSIDNTIQRIKNKLAKIR